MIRRKFLGAFLCVGSWLGLSNSVTAQGPIRRVFDRLRLMPPGRFATPEAAVSYREPQWVFHAANGENYERMMHDRRSYQAARANMRQVVGFTIWIMLLIWVIQVIIEWLIRNRMSLTFSDSDRRRMNHAMAEWEKLQFLAVERGCRVDYDEGINKEVRQ